MVLVELKNLFFIGNTDNKVLICVGGADRNITIQDIGWYVPHYTASISEGAIVSKYFFSKSTLNYNILKDSLFRGFRSSAFLAF